MQHVLTVKLEERENSITISIKESDIKFEDIIFLIKYADFKLDDRNFFPEILDNLKLNEKYLSLVDFEKQILVFKFETISQKDHWAKIFRSLTC